MCTCAHVCTPISRTIRASDTDVTTAVSSVTTVLITETVRRVTSTETSRAADIVSRSHTRAFVHWGKGRGDGNRLQKEVGWKGKEGRRGGKIRRKRRKKREKEKKEQ